MTDRDLSELVRDYRRAIEEQKRIAAEIREVAPSRNGSAEHRERLEQLLVMQRKWAEHERVCLRRLRGEEEEEYGTC